MAEVNDGFLEDVVKLEGHDLLPKDQEVLDQKHLSVYVALRRVGDGGE